MENNTKLDKLTINQIKEYSNEFFPMSIEEQMMMKGGIRVVIAVYNVLREALSISADVITVRDFLRNRNNNSSSSVCPDLSAVLAFLDGYDGDNTISIGKITTSNGAQFVNIVVTPSGYGGSGSDTGGYSYCPTWGFCNCGSSGCPVCNAC